MKHYPLIVAAAMFVGMTGVASAECDPKKGDRDADKQTRCSEKCEDNWLSHKMNYGAVISKLREEATACFEKCGCAEYGETVLK